MAGFARRMTVIGGVVGLLMSGAAVAETAGKPSQTAAQSRLAWAKRHIELVCRPLEAKQYFDRATRCYDDVSRLVGEVSRPAPAATDIRKVTRTAAVPAARTAPVQRSASVAPVVRRAAARPIAEVAPVAVVTAPPASRGCSGIACLQRYTLLGVGF